MNPDTEPTRDDGDAHGALQRIESTIRADVEEARAIEPLVEQAKAVPKRLLVRALPLLILAAIGATLVFGGVYDKLDVASLARYQAELQALVARHPVLAALALYAGIAAIVSTGLPGGAVLVLGGGFLLGIVEATAIAVAGNVTGTTILYLAARRLFVGGGTPPAVVERIRAGFQANPVSFAFFIRLVPVFPIGVSSVALAWLGCRLPLFLVATAIGVIPSTTIIAAIGAGIGTTLAENGEVSLSILAQPRFAIPLLALAALALLPALLGLRRRSAN